MMLSAADLLHVGMEARKREKGDSKQRIQLKIDRDYLMCELSWWSIFTLGGFFTN